MKRLTPVLLAALTFFSCRTQAHLPLPGENTVIKNNLAAEYLSIADEYFSLAKYEKAEDYYKRAMKNKKLYWSAYYKLGRTSAMAKKWREARKIYLVLLKRDPENLNIRLSLAYITAMDGKFQAAEAVYAYLWKYNADNPDVIVNYISVLLAQEKIEDAEFRLGELKEKFKDNANIQSFEKKIEDLKDKKEKAAAKKRKSKNAAKDEETEKAAPAEENAPLEKENVELQKK